MGHVRVPATAPSRRGRALRCRAPPPRFRHRTTQFQGSAPKMVFQPKMVIQPKMACFPRRTVVIRRSGESRHGIAARDGGLGIGPIDGQERMTGDAHPRVKPHFRDLPLRVGTRGSPLALIQTRLFLDLLTTFCPVLRGMSVFEEHAIRTTGDRVQDRRLSEIGGKGLFAKEIHEALADGRIDFAVHSLKDLETELPAGIVLACTLKREDARDVLVLGPACNDIDLADPYVCLPVGAVIGTSSVRRQAQLLHARPDLVIGPLRGNVQTRLAKLADGACAATLLAYAGLKRLDMAEKAAVVLDAEIMVPSAGQGVIGVTVRADDRELRELLAAIEDPEAKA